MTEWKRVGGVGSSGGLSSIRGRCCVGGGCWAPVVDVERSVSDMSNGIGTLAAHTSSFVDDVVAGVWSFSHVRDMSVGCC